MRRSKATLVHAAAAAALVFGALPLMAQQPPPAAGPDSGPHMMEGHRGPMERALRMGPPGRWWDNPELAKEVGLSGDQQKKMDEIFQQSRLKLIDQHAAVEKEETILEPLVSADQPDESKVLSQIDRLAQARTELEKTNARMLLDLRRVLTTAQWHTLQSIQPRRDRGPDGMRGPRGRRGPDGSPEAPGAPNGGPGENPPGAPPPPQGSF